MITAVRRLSDGLLCDIQESPQFPANVTPRKANAINYCGGAPEDWQVIEIPDGVWNGSPVGAARFASVDGQGVATEVTTQGPPALTTDRDTIVNNGVQTATLTCDVGSVAFTDAVLWSVTDPEGTRYDTQGVAADGVDTLILTTMLEGTHTIVADTVVYGVAQITVEGV